MSYIVNVSESGRLSLPAPLRKKLGLTSAGSVLIDETEDGLVLRTVEQSVARAQALFAKFSEGKPEMSVDDFLRFRKTDSGE